MIWVFRAGLLFLYYELQAGSSDYTVDMRDVYGW